MKIDYVRPNISFSKPRFEFYKGGEWVIDERGFKKTPPYQDVCSGKKLGSQPLNKAQTAPSS